MKTSQAGIDLIKRWEGLRLKSYKCPSNIWTIGYGHTGEEAQPNNEITAHEAEELLKKDVKWAEDATNSMFDGLTQNQFDAIVSITYNMGVSRFRKQKLCTSIQYNPNSEMVRNYWSETGVRNSKGIVLKGLQNRRKEEVKLYFNEI